MVKRLSAIEDLGSIEVLCADKTGTLTENKLAVTEIKGNSPQNAIFYAVLASPFSSKKDHALKSSFDLALFEKLDHRQKLELKNYQKLEESPFDPERRKNSVLVQKDKNRELIVRGAPEVAACVAYDTGIKDFSVFANTVKYIKATLISNFGRGRHTF